MQLLVFISRRSMSIEATQNDEEREWRAHIAAIAEETVSKSRKSIFRRRTKAKVSDLILLFNHSQVMAWSYITQVIPPHGAMSDTELLEDLTSGRAGHLSPRVSMSATEDEPSSGPNTPKRKFSKFNIGRWIMGSALSAMHSSNILHLLCFKIRDSMAFSINHEALCCG